MNGVVAVVGSTNLDVVVSASVRPAGGETVLGAALVEVPGARSIAGVVITGAPRTLLAPWPTVRETVMASVA